MNRNSHFLAEFLFEPCCKDDAEGQLRFAIVGAKWWGAFWSRVVLSAGIWLLLTGWVYGSSLCGSTYSEMILNGSFPLSPEATLVILYQELELLLIPEDANSLELSASFWMEGNSQDQFRAERCSAFCCRFTAVDTSSPTSSSGQCTSTMFSFSTASKTASGGPLSQSTPLPASLTTPLKASTPVPATGRSLMHIVGNNAL